MTYLKMTRRHISVVLSVLMCSAIILGGGKLAYAANTAPPKPCPAQNDPKTLQQDVYGIPTWYKYLDGVEDQVSKKCVPLGSTNFDPALLKSNIPAIGLALLEILLRLTVITAVVWMIYGGFQYLISQGEPDRTRAAKDTVLNALIGVVIAMIASSLVAFIGTKLYNP